MRPRALVFDDDSLIRHLLWRYLDRRGYEVFTFPDPGLCPLHAKDRCLCDQETTCTDIILSDLNMPNVKGLDFVEELFAKGCRCHNIALMSGAWSEHDVARANSLGCKLFSKPFTIAEIQKWLVQVEGRLTPDRKLLEGLSFRMSTESARMNSRQANERPNLFD